MIINTLLLGIELEIKVKRNFLNFYKLYYIFKAMYFRLLYYSKLFNTSVIFI